MTEPIYSVDEVFSNRHASMPIMPDMNITGEELRQKFDRPDDLMVVSHDGITAVIHKEGCEYLARRADVVRELLVEKGIIQKDIGNMSFDDIMFLREEISHRLGEEQPKNDGVREI